MCAYDHPICRVSALVVLLLFIPSDDVNMWLVNFQNPSLKRGSLHAAFLACFKEWCLIWWRINNHALYYDCPCSLWWKFKNYIYTHTHACAHGCVHFLCVYFDIVSDLKGHFSYHCFIATVTKGENGDLVWVGERRECPPIWNLIRVENICRHIFTYLKCALSVTTKCRMLRCSSSEDSEVDQQWLLQFRNVWSRSEENTYVRLVLLEQSRVPLWRKSWCLLCYSALQVLQR